MRGRPVLGVLSGLLFGAFLAVTLVLADLLPLNSVWVTLMPVLGVGYGLGMSLWAPFGRTRANLERSDRDALPVTATPPQD